MLHNYFWRTYDQQEVDWVEDRGCKLYAYEFKLNPEKKSKAPGAWNKGNPDAEFAIIHPENYRDGLLK